MQSRRDVRRACGEDGGHTACQLLHKHRDVPVSAVHGAFPAGSQTETDLSVVLPHADTAQLRVRRHHVGARIAGRLPAYWLRTYRRHAQLYFHNSPLPDGNGHAGDVHDDGRTACRRAVRTGTEAHFPDACAVFLHPHHLAIKQSAYRLVCLRVQLAGRLLRRHRHAARGLTACNAHDGRRGEKENGK